jgi:heme oxygenase
MSRLKEAIMPLHDEAEKFGPLHTIPKGTATLDQYEEILKRLYGFVFPAEEMIEPGIIRENMRFDYDYQRRLPHLVKDLDYFGISETEAKTLPRCNSLPLLDSFDSTLGLLYLFEGSRLGGQVLAKALRDKFGFQNNQGYCYFGSDEVDIGPRWKSFRLMVEDHVNSGGKAHEIISSAQTGFACLNRWLHEQ